MSEAAAEKGEEKKSSKKKLIIIIAASLVLLAGGGGAAYYFFLKPDPAKHEGENGEKEGAEPEHGDKAESGHGEEGDGHEGHNSDGSVRLEMLYYDMGKPFVVSLPMGSSAKLASVQISVSVEDQETIDALKKHEPMIRNDLMMLIGSQKTEELKTREGKEKLREVMLKTIIDILKKKTGKAHVVEVFFTAFVLQ